MCGIFGNITNNPSKIDVSSVNILGIYNTERGKQSCGLTWDGEIQHGIDKDKLYIDFIKNRSIKPKYFPTIFGHTRQASAGNLITVDNAHPFGYGVSKDGNSFEFTFVHNGTLKNHKELAKKYGIETSVKCMKKSSVNGSTYETTREKIDSEILGEILWKEKSYHVLSEYIGAAACAWVWWDEPNKVYLWSGASKLHIDDGKEEKSYEERPLCVYQKSKNNTFFSSIKESLTSIGANESNVFQIQYNHVHIITDGDYKNCEKIRATRINAAQDDSYKWGHQNPYSRQPKNQDYYNNITNNVNINSTSGLDIQSDRPINDINSYVGKVYSKNLRYYKNGHLINGVYVYVLNYGFVKVGDDYVSAYTVMQVNKGKVFHNGTWSMTLKEGYIPFAKDALVIQFHYFIEGAMLRTLNDYVKCKDISNNLPSVNKHISPLLLSNMTKHPVATLVSTTRPSSFLDGEVFTGSVVELGYEKIYTFNKGVFISAEKRKDIANEEKPVIQLPMNLNSVIESKDDKVLNESIKQIRCIEDLFDDSIDSKINSIIKNHFDVEIEEKEIDPEEEQEIFLAELIDEEFSTNLDNLKGSLIDLSDYKENALVKEAIITLNLVITAMNDFIMTPQENKNE